MQNKIYKFAKVPISSAKGVTISGFFSSYSGMCGTGDVVFSYFLYFLFFLIDILQSFINTGFVISLAVPQRVLNSYSNDLMKSIQYVG